MAQPTEEELASVELACQKLWELDENRLEPETHYRINLQVRTCNHGEQEARAHDVLSANSKDV